MLDGLLGRGFASKCKSSIKVTRTRIDVIRRKRNATQKFLKKDVADLLANGLDINAYGRAEGLLAELILSSCYDFVEQSCEFILKHLSVMQKQSECPEECRVAVASLMFAAARFSDLPELRDLRQVFQERYGNSLEYFVNQEFVENLSSKPPTQEKKLQLMQDIALEFSIRWDSRAFEKRMSNPSVSVQGQPKKHGSLHVPDDKYKSPNGSDIVPKRDKHDVLPREKHELSNDGNGFRNRREANVPKKEQDLQFFGRQEGNGHKPLNGREETILKRDDHDISFQKRQEVIADKHEPRNGKEDATPKTIRVGSSSRGKRLECLDGGYNLQNGRENTVPKRESQDNFSHGKQVFASSCERMPVKSDVKDVPFAGYNHVGQQDVANSTRKVQGEEADRLKSYSNAIPPPYVKPPKASKRGANSGSKHAGFDCNGASTDSSTHNRANVGNRSERSQIGSYHSDYEMQVAEAVRVNSHNHEKDPQYHDDAAGDPMPKPRSMRRRHSKSQSSHDDIGNFEERRVVRRNPSGRRRGDSRRGLQILFDDDPYKKDEEEKIIDKLLMHYSKKPSTYEGKVRKRSKAHPSHDIAVDAGESAENIGSSGPDMGSEMVRHPARSVSLPHEQTGPSEPTKVFARAASFQPDRLSPARHVHPKLPDYDDLAARFGALKGR
ncbi:hypothetical protein L1049_001483 [Liquidambar formosana]|uniref:IST1-like protein n=1 Tax=Liquidambar formosana TaxID=63359 RepID=A0AAP0NDD2_LIQFO